MAITLEQMAGAYTQYVRQEIDILNKDIDERRNKVKQLEQHLLECLNSMEKPKQITGPLKQPTSTKIINEDGTQTETINLPNPFEQLGIQ